MDAPWEIELLGWLRATQGSRTVSRFRSHETAVLLAYLAYYQHRSHPREALIELLWPECAPSDGRNRLSVALSSLRRQLEPPGVPAGAVILANRSTVQLNPAASVTDVARFEAALQTAGGNGNTAEGAQRLAEAVTLYQGDLLPGYCEAWVLPERQRLTEAFHQALHQLAALTQHTGDLQGALTYARLAVGRDPLREETHHDLIRLLAAAGQPEAALRQYQEMERLLAQELRALPAPETRDLAEQIRGQSGPSTAAGSLDHLRAPSPLPDGAAPRRRHADERTSLEPRSHADDHQADLPEFPPPQAAPAHSGSLPLQFTRFFGREAEIEQLVTAIGITRCAGDADSPSLVTLTGPGGSGKTRLAVEVAQRLREAWSGAVWFVPLVDLAEPRLIADRALDSLGLLRTPGQDPLEQVVAFFSRQPALLLLDNFEHLVEGGAEIVQALLTRVPSLRVLVTSRQRLDLPGERELPVPPLPVPGQRDEGKAMRDESEIGPSSSLIPRPSSLIVCPSVALFVDRSQAVRPDFQVTRGNADAVAALCVRLEGLPLAIELAAARAGVLSPAQILSRLEQRFELLVSRRRRTDARHCSLRAALDWSYQLLSPELQRFFARLSVFRGGWTLEAAEAVCGDFGLGRQDQGQLSVRSLRSPTIQNPTSKIQNPLDLLASLVDNSLVQQGESASGEPRFRMLETIREYGQECLAESGEADTVRRQHAEFFMALAEEAEPELWRDISWLDRLEGEHDNLRAALEWCAETGARGQGSGVRKDEPRGPVLPGLTPSPAAWVPAWPLTPPEIGLRLAGALWWFWDIRAYHAEARRRLETALAGSTGRGTPAHRKALCAVAYRGDQGDLAQATALAEESLALCRRAGDKSGMGWSLAAVLAVAWRQGNMARTQELAAEALSLFRESGDQRGMAWVLQRLGSAEWLQGRRERAEALLEEGLALCRSAGYRWFSAGSLFTLGQSLLDAGRIEPARALIEESLAISREFGLRSMSAWSLNALAQVAQSTGDDARATALFEESLAVLREFGNPSGRALTLMKLGDLALARGEHGGAKESFEEALVLARKGDYQAIVALALLGLAGVAQAQGDHRTARALFEEAPPPDREVGSKGIADHCMRQGDLLLELGDTAAARSRYEEGLALRRAGEYAGLIARALLAVGHAAWCQGDHAAARSHALEALALFREQENKEGVFAALESLAATAAARGRKEHAARLAGAVGTLRETLGLPGASWWRRPRERMGETAFTAAWKAGEALTWQQAAALALEEAEPDAGLSLPLPARETDLPPDNPALLPQDDLTEEEWERIAPLLPASAGRRGRPYQEHRRVIDGIMWKLRTGEAWRDLPGRYGAWHTCHNRYARWQRQGLWEKIVAALRPESGSAGAPRAT